MDLKDVIVKVKSEAMEAHNAFHAGHNKTAQNHLATIVETVKAYYCEINADDIAEINRTTNEKKAETLQETQAKVSGLGVHPAVIDPAAAAEQIGQGQADEKPTQ